ncbi:Co2+/Mg2+ efflux protein ApaG [Sapientia aquatica]|uniref:Protein ApaG n=1 Tax=Sapientia aquatica TaxID=1549640 RepID=A0A4R5VUB6_9BURK|nr:Co2+/Mg2+ efflux protein ApaG [Sapientia aquatica]TDK62519.1 Co2+/Mg2+ efflux protein ApaG [Sapientia aquatica]
MALYEFSISVTTQYLEPQSDPAAQRYVFSYTVTIKNTGSVKAQLIARHWFIKDANGKEEQVRGLGVIGYQPLLDPGQEFEYTSGTALETSVGSMHGTYLCVAEDGEQFTAVIPEFVMTQPRTLH